MCTGELLEILREKDRQIVEAENGARHRQAKQDQLQVSRPFYSDENSPGKSCLKSSLCVWQSWSKPELRFGWKFVHSCCHSRSAVFRRSARGGGETLLATRKVGVCSIFLRIDRSINEIHKLRALFFNQSIYKKYRMHLLITDIFMFTSFL